MENTLTKKWFLWGLLLSWVPWIPMMVSIRYLFIGINHSRAIGLAAVAGGMAEGLVLWGVVAMFISQIAAIVWLFRSFSRDLWIRNVVPVISMGMSALMLTMVGLFLWIVWFQTRHPG